MRPSQNSTPGIFITGTDTGVGKTVVTCAIAAALTQRGLRVGVYKPAETGCPLRDGERVGEDCERLAAAAGGMQTPREVATYLLAEPAAPIVAAEAEGVTLEAGRMLADYRALAARFDFMLVEGAGGLLVPITESFSFRDLARELALPVLCVVASRLGCINHARLTLEAARSGGLAVAGYVMNEMQASDEYALAARTNAAVLARIEASPQLAVFPHLGTGPAHPHLRSGVQMAEALIRLFAL